MKIKIVFLILLSILSFTVTSGQKPNKKIQITGIVTDINKKPISGVAVLVDNKSTNKVTNKNGFYKVTVKSDSKTISVLSASGQVAESKIDGSAEINFSLPIDVMKDAKVSKYPKGEEDVNIGYGTVKQKNMLTPVNQIDGTNKKYASYQSIYEMLRGQPGVQVNGTSIKIQGAASFTSGTEPLFVVDGIVVNSIEGIQPNMVKSIEILKGPAASIYGSRGANGVILINLLRSKDFK